MTERLARLGARRAALRARSERLRAELGMEGQALARRFAAADRLVAAARSGTGQALLMGTAALLLFGRPRRALGLALRALALWPMAAPLLPVLRHLLDRRAARTAAR